MKIYNFYGMRFKQDELTFAEDGAVRELLGRITTLTKPDATLGEWLDAILKEKIAESLFQIILKPYEPTPVHRLKHKVLRWRSEVAPGGSGILPRLRNSQVAEVLADFFELNTIWMRGFSGIVNSLVPNRTVSGTPAPGNTL